MHMAHGVCRTHGALCSCVLRCAKSNCICDPVGGPIPYRTPHSSLPRLHCDGLCGETRASMRLRAMDPAPPFLMHVAYLALVPFSWPSCLFSLGPRAYSMGPRAYSMGPRAWLPSPKGLGPLRLSFIIPALPASPVVLPELPGGYNWTDDSPFGSGRLQEGHTYASCLVPFGDRVLTCPSHSLLTLIYYQGAPKCRFLCSASICVMPYACE